MDWLLALASLIATVLNIKKKAICFWIWSITNFLWMVVDYKAGLYGQSALFLTYFALAIWGIFQWKKPSP